MLADVNWTAIGSAATAIGVVVSAIIGVREIRQNRAGISNVSDRITTPGDLPPIGQATAQVLEWQDDHGAKDERRFERIENRLGIEPEGV